MRRACATRIDITEVEADTKIRAKYLRALENEEWDLLPGPTFVQTFLRTYADYLGLDARLLVEEYKQRFERPLDEGAAAVRPAAGRGRRRAPAPRGARAARSWSGGALRRCWARCSPSARWARTTRAAATTPNTVENPTADPGRRRRAQGRSRSPRPPRRVTLQIVPTGTVYVCLVDANGRALIDNQDLQAGERSKRYRGRRFRVTFGNGQARLRVGRPPLDVPDRATPVGYELRPGRRARELPEARRPTCT